MTLGFFFFYFSDNSYFLKVYYFEDSYEFSKRFSKKVLDVASGAGLLSKISP